MGRQVFLDTHGILQCRKHSTTVQRRLWWLKINIRRVLCIFGSHTFVPTSWMCKKQTSVSQSSTEAEIISLVAGLRRDGIPAPTLWDLEIQLFHSVPNETEGPKREPLGNPSAIAKSNMHNPISVKHTNVIPTYIDHIPSNAKNSDSSAMLYVFEDIEAVIKMIVKGRSPTLKHVSRTHRVALDWLFDRINLHSKIQIRYIDTKHQLVDMLTEGKFTHDEWNHLLHVLNVPFQLHLLHQGFQLDKLLQNGEEDSKSKGRRESCVQVATSSDEYVFLFYCDKFFRRIESDSI